MSFEDVVAWVVLLVIEFLGFRDEEAWLTKDVKYRKMVPSFKGVEENKYRNFF